LSQLGQANCYAAGLEKGFTTMELISEYNNLTFKIVEDIPEVGFYLYVYDSLNNCINDYLQDTELLTKEFAFKEFGVPLHSWTEK